MKKHKKLIAIIIVFLILALSIFIIIRYNYLYSYSSREKDFKSNIRVADEVRIVSGNTGEYILLSTENIEKLADKVDKVDFEYVLRVPRLEQRAGWSHEILYRVGENDWWSMVFGSGYTQIVHNNDWKYYHDNRDLEEYVETMYKELGGK